MEEKESKNSSTLAIVALAVVGVIAVGAPLVSVAGIALVTDIQAAAGQCSPSAVVSDGDSEDTLINVPNGWAPLVEEAAKTAGPPSSKRSRIGTRRRAAPLGRRASLSSCPTPGPPTGRAGT